MFVDIWWFIRITITLHKKICIIINDFLQGRTQKTILWCVFEKENIFFSSCFVPITSIHIIIGTILFIYKSCLCIFIFIQILLIILICYSIDFYYKNQRFRPLGVFEHPKRPPVYVSIFLSTYNICNIMKN